MAKPSVTVSGLDDINRAFEAMDIYTLNPLIVEGLTAAANVVAEEARANAPVLTGALRKGIKVRKGRNKADFKSVLVSLGQKYFKGTEFYGAFQEFGWKVGARNRRKKAGEDKRKQVPGLHFMEKAFNSKAAQAQAEMIAVWQKGIKDAAGL